jgi:uncharacterized protein DUF4136
MRAPGPRLIAVVIAAGILAASQPGIAKVKIRSNFDKTFAFKQARTWSWNTKGAGDIVASRTKEDNPEEIRKRAEPIIMEAVRMELPRRGLQAATGEGDLTLTYYLLLSIGSSAQTLGQFLPSTVQWGVPPFAPVTQSLELIEQGSLVLDLSAKGQLVWRGIAEAEIKTDMDQQKRAKLLRDAVKKIVEKYPPKV